MIIKTKKSLILKLLKEDGASRSDSIINNNNNFYGNFGSVKSFNTFDEDTEDLPLKASEHMATQLTVEEPPVDAPEYIPGTVEE